MGLEFKTTTKPKKRFRLLVILVAIAAIPSQLAVADVGHGDPRGVGYSAQSMLSVGPAR